MKDCRFASTGEPRQRAAGKAGRRLHFICSRRHVDEGKGESVEEDGASAKRERVSAEMNTGGKEGSASKGRKKVGKKDIGNSLATVYRAEQDSKGDSGVFHRMGK
ncbi:hypothetical protein LX36DRAFT_191037 [Colletotrichum falcatum]|nr:hypothetical protein LX36DRAFT_191037 [Colletotrichum falcatum]